MSKSKGSQPKQGIVNSRTRDHQRLAELYVRKATQSPEIDPGSLTRDITKLNPPPNDTEVKTSASVGEQFIEMQKFRGYTLEQLDDRMKEVFEGELMLDPSVRLLFELTRDGIPASAEYRNELLQPAVTYENIVGAIELGIKAWAPTLLSKER